MWSVCQNNCFVLLGLPLVKMLHLCPAYNQDVHPSKGIFLCFARFLHVSCMQLSCCPDVPSFGSFSSRCFIFRRRKLYLHVCVCATFVLTRCSIFWQLLVKMFHLLLREVVFACMCVCMCIVCASFVLTSSVGRYTGWAVIPRWN